MRLKTKFQDEDFDLGEVVDGVIVECLGKHEEELRVIVTAAKGGQHIFCYSSIKKFMDDWEDAPEEAEEAVRKLKAWERLKDKGFRFEGYSNDEHGEVFIKTNLHISEITLFDDSYDKNSYDKKTLDLLFGGEG